MAGEENEDDVVAEETEAIAVKDVSESADSVGTERLIKLPLSRVKYIIKSDPDVTLASQEAVVALARATELFIQMISKDASGSTMQGKRKTLQRKDLDHVLDTRDCYLFLDGALD